MARRKRPGSSDATASSDESAGQRPQLGSPWKMWIEDAWHGWIKSMSGLLVLALAYFAYTRHWIGETAAGPLVVAVIVGGTIAFAAVPVFPLLTSPRARLLFGVFVPVWAIAAGFGPMERALPREIVGEKRLADVKGHLEDTIATNGYDGPFVVLVEGELKGQGDVEVPYRLTVAGDGSEDLSGTLSRKFVTQRVGRRGGTQTTRQDLTENLHRVNLHGQALKLSLDLAESDYDKLEAGVQVTVRKAAVDPMYFLWLAIACALVALVVDYTLASPAVKTYLTMAAGLLAVFAWYYPTEATPHRLVPPAVGGLFVALMTGGLGGALVAFIARSFKPKAQMKAPPKPVKK